MTCELGSGAGKATDRSTLLHLPLRFDTHSPISRHVVPGQVLQLHARPAQQLGVRAPNEADLGVHLWRSEAPHEQGDDARGYYDVKGTVATVHIFIPFISQLDANHW